MHAIGMIESNSIAKGIECADVMVKAGDVRILVTKSICPGKYIVLIGGDVAAVQQAIKAGLSVAPEIIVDHFVISNVHPSILPAISGGTVVDRVQSIGVVETYSVAATIEAADTAVKAAMVTPLRMHLAFGIGGKSYVVFAGDIANIETAVEIASTVASNKGLLTQNTVIARPHQQVIDSLL